MIGLMLLLQACPDPTPHITVNSDDFNIQAVNLSVDDGKLTATGGNPIVTVNWTTNITINGVTTTVSGTKKSDELPVMAGDEIEIRFTRSCPEQTEATFTLPDGTTRTITVDNPSFKWTVPANFTPGMEIKGETHYETDDAIYNRTGSITLIELK